MLDPEPMIRDDITTEIDDPPHFGSADEGRLVSSDDFAVADFEPPWTYERVEGRLQVTSPEGWEHVSVSEPWRDRLGAYALLHPAVVQRVVSQAWLRVDGRKDRIGDIGIYLVDGLNQILIPDRVPELMFEFVSPSKDDKHRDYVLKRADYQRAGVREYVIVARFERQVTVLTLGPDGYTERVITARGTYDSPLLPGLEIALTEIWPR